MPATQLHTARSDIPEDQLSQKHDICKISKVFPAIFGIWFLGVEKSLNHTCLRTY